MFASSQALHTSVWLKEWRQCMDAPDGTDVPPALRSRLLDPLRAGDPVFATMLCRDLLADPSNIEAAIRVLCAPSGRRPARVLLCEAVFYVAKCTAAECRLFVASVAPALLWAEWTLGGQFAGGDSDDAAASSAQGADDDLAALEVALLAAYQQDYGVAPLPPVLRVPSLAAPSIYHRGAADVAFEAFGADACAAETTMPAWLCPAGVSRLDCHSRLVVTHRLCRAVHDVLPDVHDHALLSYALLIATFAAAGDADYALGAQMCDPGAPADGAQAAALRDSLCAAATMRAPEAVPHEARPFPVCEALLVLWAEALCLLTPRVPALIPLLRSYLQQSAVHHVCPTAILALSAIL